MKQTIDEMAENWFSKLPSARHARGEIKESFLIAYKDGYTDAQRWHYTSEGNKPEDFEDVLMFCKNRESATYTKMGYIQNGFLVRRLQRRT